MKLEPSISTNPYIAFPFKAKKSGTFNFEWIDDNGKKYTMKRKMKVS
jgi:sulfur-oxidizing protein SoxZ